VEPASAEKSVALARWNTRGGRFAGWPRRRRNLFWTRQSAAYGHHDDFGDLFGRANTTSIRRDLPKRDKGGAQGRSTT